MAENVPSAWHLISGKYVLANTTPHNSITGTHSYLHEHDFTNNI
jgi:hypothetical protein